MPEQPDAEENRGFAIVSLKLALSQEARTSLAAVRVAQESARRRARRQTMQARLGLALLVGAATLGAIAARPRVERWRQSRTRAAMAVPAPPRTATTAPALASPPVPRHAAQAAIVAQPTVAQPAAPRAPAKVAANTGVPAEGCDTSTRRGLWRRSPEACARAFAAEPKNASLALAVAQSEHAHGRLDEAARWAKRTLALDPSAAEAYIIIARDDVANGRDGDAQTDYQRYLELAPRGWHKAEARAALRGTSGTSR